MTAPRVGSGALFGGRRLEMTSEQKSEYAGMTTGNCFSWSRKQGAKILGDGRDADERAQRHARLSRRPIEAAAALANRRCPLAGKLPPACLLIE